MNKWIYVDIWEGRTEVRTYIWSKNTSFEDMMENVITSETLNLIGYFDEIPD